MNDEHLVVQYSCSDCGLVDIEVGMPFRPAERNLMEWMDSAVIPAIVADHCGRSPLCSATSLQNLKIPLPHGADRIGGPNLQ